MSTTEDDPIVACLVSSPTCAQAGEAASTMAATAIPGFDMANPYFFMPE